MIGGARSSATSLTGRTVRGLGWTWGALLFTTALQVAYTAAISRLLEPADFGTMAAALLSLRFVTHFSNLGLATAVIQREHLDPRDISTALRLAGGIGISAATVVFLMAPGFAALVGTPAATEVIRWVAISIPLGTLGAVCSALLRRALRFRASSAISVASYAIGYVGIGLTTAYQGWGVWSLVAANLGQATLMLIGSFVAARPAFRGGFSYLSARNFLSFGGMVSINGFLGFLAGSLDTLSVGRYLGPSSLGQYSRAAYLVSLPVENSMIAVSRVLLPGLSSVRTDTRRFTSALTVAIGIQAPVVLVATGMIAAAGPALVPWLLGPGWEDAVSVLPMVGLAGAVALLTNSPGIAAEAMGLLRQQFFIQVSALIVTVLSIGIVLRTDPTLVRLAGAWTAGQVFRHLLYWRFIIPALGLVLSDIFKRYSSSCLLAIAAMLPSTIAFRFYSMQGFTALLVAFTLGLFLAGLVFMTPVASVIRGDLASVRNRLQSHADSPQSLKKDED